MNKLEGYQLVPVWERTLLTLDEATAYTGVGTKKLRALADEPLCDFVVWIGKHRMFKRKKLEEFLDDAVTL